MKREPIPKALRFQVLSRDGFRCRYCGAHADDTVLHLDHRIPVSKGGATTFSNLVAACISCNLGKRDGIVEIQNVGVPDKERRLAFATYVFEYALDNFRVPIPIQGWAWREISSMTRFLKEAEIIDIVNKSDDWFSFYGRLLESLDPTEDSFSDVLDYVLGGGVAANDDEPWDVL